jgi:Protein of unknown function (DUF3467)
MAAAVQQVCARERMGEPLEGRYANYFELGFTAFEFILDFGQFDQETGAVVRHTRIITNPASAKVLLDMLRDLVSEYDAKLGSAGEPER